jgi:ribonucleoside-diphosphate reductase alpha chain
MDTYTREEVYNATLDYFKGDTFATDVWVNKYSLKEVNNETNQIIYYEKTPNDMFHRLSKEFARIEKKYPNPLSEDEIFELLKDFKYVIPQGGPLSGIGNDFQVNSLSNCFVIGNKLDSYGAIFQTDQEQVQLMKRRGGVGHDLSYLRPKGTKVNNSALTSTGIVPFMERYSNSTKEVAQEGRRGALLLSIDVKHPDAESFIDAKLTEGKVTGANISVKLSDEFMNSAFSDGKFIQQFPIDSSNPSIKKEIDSIQLWKKIVHNAWSSAEPGILFWDNIIKESLPDCYKDFGFESISTNPCSEISICFYGTCILITNNLYSYVINPFTKNASFDFDRFKSNIMKAQRLIDDLVDLELEKVDKILLKIKNDPEPKEVKIIELNLWNKIKEKIIQGRRTGLGITAEGDMLAAMGLIYGTKEATEFAVQVQKEFTISAYLSDSILAKERGPFPIYNFELEKENLFLKRIFNESNKLKESIKKYGRRNIACLTISPTGSVSTLTQTTSGIEPAFLISYKRRRKINPTDKNSTVSYTDKEGVRWEEYNVFHHKFEKWLEVNGYNVEEVKSYSNDELNLIIEKSPYFKATTRDVNWVEKVKMQGKLQKWTDHSISATTNLPNSATEELVSQVYETAWRSGCKGHTVYREGSRQGVLISNEIKPRELNTITKNNAPKRPVKLKCNIHQITAKGQEWIVLVGMMNGGDSKPTPYEVFAFKKKNIAIGPKIDKGILHRKKSGYYNLEIEGVITLENITELFEQDEEEALTRQISLNLRHGCDVKFIVEQLNKAEGTVASFSKAIMRALKKYIDDSTEVKGELCPTCGEKLVYIEGCVRCVSCSFSKCG